MAVGADAPNVTTVTPPPRWSAFMAAAADGKLWLIGGNSFTGLLADVWSFDPVSLVWTFEAGSQSPVSTAQAVYGRFRVPAASNVMPSRAMFAAAMDKHADVIFISGGLAAGNAALADVWSFNVTSKLFAWIGGQPGESRARGIYPAVKGFDGGELRVSRPNNFGGNAWVDASGGLWLGMGRHYNWQEDQYQHCNGATTRAQLMAAALAAARS